MSKGIIFFIQKCVVCGWVVMIGANMQYQEQPIQC